MWLQFVLWFFSHSLCCDCRLLKFHESREKRTVTQSTAKEPTQSQTLNDFFFSPFMFINFSNPEQNFNRIGERKKDSQNTKEDLHTLCCERCWGAKRLKWKISCISSWLNRMWCFGDFREMNFQSGIWIHYLLAFGSTFGSPLSTSHLPTSHVTLPTLPVKLNKFHFVTFSFCSLSASPKTFCFIPLLEHYFPLRGESLRFVIFLTYPTQQKIREKRLRIWIMAWETE